MFSHFCLNTLKHILEISPTLSRDAIMLKCIAQIWVTGFLVAGYLINKEIEKMKVICICGEKMISVGTGKITHFEGKQEKELCLEYFRCEKCGNMQEVVRSDKNVKRVKKEE